MKVRTSRLLRIRKEIDAMLSAAQQSPGTQNYLPLEGFLVQSIGKGEAGCSELRLSIEMKLNLAVGLKIPMLYL